MQLAEFYAKTSPPAVFHVRPKRLWGGGAGLSAHHGVDVQVLQNVVVGKGLPVGLSGGQAEAGAGVDKHVVEPVWQASKAFVRGAANSCRLTWLGAMSSASQASTCCRAAMAWLHGWLFGAAQHCSGCLIGASDASMLLLEPWAALTGSIVCSCLGKWLSHSPGCTDQSVLQRLPETAGQLPEQCTAWWQLTAGEPCSAAVASEACGGAVWWQPARFGCGCS